ncbi:T-cell activation inhibitor, mitochondrial-like [Leptonychotes weddellii]|uniref:T-cell activation inhibitor, mitochondrial-like n=1 Tax=Leptonychotes weddellii TaxID=9713 RepID=A0A7F8RDI3_LEPWE|nr:T-cell activation inhibitor, mitochondrial-like [Leptonychotes weddellii]
MFCHLRPVRRSCLEKIFPHWFLSSRALSGAEAVNALRPFYFAVHPDFFGQHPREREVNENSLKRLSVYLENLQKPGFKSLKPTQLTFYVRETEQNSSEGQEPFSTSGFRAVKFTLHTRDLLSTVLYILNSCSLSIEHIQSLNTNVHSQPLKEAKRMSDRPIKWDKSYYYFTGFKDPHEDLEQVSRMETTLTLQKRNQKEHMLNYNGHKEHKNYNSSNLHQTDLHLIYKLYSHDQNLFLKTFYVLLFGDSLWQYYVYFQYNRLKVIENELIQASTKKFSLEKFYKEPSVSSIQMVDCCKRLLEQSLPYLQGMHLCISHFYSVLQDGDLCIPWNWKDGEAIK